MKNYLYVKKAFLLWFILFLCFSVYSQTRAIVGKWEGKLKVQGTELRVFFQIEETAPGDFKARMASPDQGANNIPVDNVVWKNDSLLLDIKAVGGRYRGKLLRDKKMFNGVWEQGGAVFPLDVTQVVTLLFYPTRRQEPKRPFPYTEKNIKYGNNIAGITLGATLTLPPGEGPFPAVLLINGSGSQNRDAEIMGHKPFLVLSDYLTRRGIAVLRVDDRGVGESTGSSKTTEDNVSDAQASLNFLKTHSAIKKDMIGLIGHSEGGMVASILASKLQDIGFIVLLAGVGLPGDQLHRFQTEDMLRLSGSKEDEIQKVLALNDKLYAVIKAKKTAPSISTELAAVLHEQVATTGIDMTEVAKALAEPWFRYFINFNPEPYLNKVSCPVLALNGSKDVQVRSKENLTAIERSLNQGGNVRVIVKELQGLNHLFQTCETGAFTEYAKIEETVAPVALTIVGDWIEELVLRDK